MNQKLPRVLRPFVPLFGHVAAIDMALVAALILIQVVQQRKGVRV